jgi:hypothetical protein
MERDRIRTRDVVIFCILALLAGYAIGFGYGTYKSLDFCINTGLNFLHAQGIEVNINEGLLRDAIQHYKRSIGDWLFKPDSPLTINTTK